MFVNILIIHKKIFFLFFNFSPKKSFKKNFKGGKGSKFKTKFFKFKFHQL